jgi:hypothetical protein
MAFGAETITLKQNMCINKFIKANVVSEEKAIDYNELKFKYSRTTKILLREGVLIVTRDNKAYLDMENVYKFKHSFKKIFI